jgi:hypothetical protein
MKVFKYIKHTLSSTIAGLVCILSLQLPALAAADTEHAVVNVDNFVRAETAS